MLRTLKYIYGFKIQTQNGDIGRLSDLFFDQRIWTVRYLVVDTSTWLKDRLVLISPNSISKADWEAETIHLDLTTRQVENSPSITDDLPVSRQAELSLMKYYGWPDYWQPMGVSIPESAILFSKKFALKKWDAKSKANSENNPYLRSSREVIGYRIFTTRGSSGRVCDYVIEDENWIIRYFVIKKNIWGRKMLMAPSWIEKVNWAKERLEISIAPHLIKRAPVFKYNRNVSREQEIQLFDYFTKPGYWEEENK
jgi:hypothetical protein